MADRDEEAPQTPDMMRRRLRVALKTAREGAGLTQRQLAEPLEWSVSKIIRIEKGSVAVSATDLKALLDVLSITEPVAREELLDLARGSRKKTWNEFRGVYSRESLTLFENEEAAQGIRKYEPSFVPGLFQTEEYAEALLGGLGIDRERVELMVRGRMERQEILERTVRPELRFIIGETALSRTVGSPGIMRQQLKKIKDLSRLPGVEVQILGFDVGAHPKMGGAFTILDFPGSSVDELLYLEDAGGEKTTRDDIDLVTEYLVAFEELRSLASAPADLVARIDKISEQRFPNSLAVDLP